LHDVQVIPTPITPRPQAERPALATFAELGFITRRVSGIGGHDLYYPVDIPYDWKPTSDAAIQLHFSHASGLTDTSLMSAYINGFKVSDVQLNNRNDSTGRLVIQLSPRQIHPGRNWLHLFYDLHLRGEDCNYRYQDEAWAEVSADESVMNLAHVASAPPLELRYLPSPLVTPVDLSANLFVLPPWSGEAELTSLVRLAAKLGTYSNADGLRPQAITADQFTSTQAADNHIIAIGTPETNALLAEYDAYLPQPLFLVNGQVQPSAGRELLPDEKNGLAGYIQLLPAPWSGRATLMVISAQRADALLRVVDVLPVVGQRLKSQGNVAVVTPGTVKGMSIGNLAGAPLSESARSALSIVLIGAFAVIGTIGVVINRRRLVGQREANDATE
jgi:hypothetical protein